MGALSNRTHQALLNSLFGKPSNFGALASAPTIYVGLSSTKPTQSGTNITEPSSGSYARVATSASDWTSATNADPSEVENADDIEFPKATADWVGGSNLAYAPLFDAPSGGNFLGFATIQTPKPVLNGDTAVFEAGDLVISLGSAPEE